MLAGTSMGSTDTQSGSRKMRHLLGLPLNSASRSVQAGLRPGSTKYTGFRCALMLLTSDTSPLRSSGMQIGPPMQISGTPTRHPFHGSGMMHQPPTQKPGRFRHTFSLSGVQTMSRVFTSTVPSSWRSRVPPLSLPPTA